MAESPIIIGPPEGDVQGPGLRRRGPPGGGRLIVKRGRSRYNGRLRWGSLPVVGGPAKPKTQENNP